MLVKLGREYILVIAIIDRSSVTVCNVYVIVLQVGKHVSSFPAFSKHRNLCLIWSREVEYAVFCVFLILCIKLIKTEVDSQ